MRSGSFVHRPTRPVRRVVHSYRRVIHRPVRLSTLTQRGDAITVMGGAGIAPGRATRPSPVCVNQALALPRIRFTVVPHTGHLPLAMFMPVFETSTVPWKSRFSLHFTQ